MEESKEESKVLLSIDDTFESEKKGQTIDDNGNELDES